MRTNLEAELKTALQVCQVASACYAVLTNEKIA